MIRSYSPADLQDAFTLYPEVDNSEINCEEWVSDFRNMLFADNGSYGVFKYDYPGVYTGHYFFRVRGREAIDLAKKILKEVFSRNGAQVIRGMTRTDNRPALWMTRHLGFSSCGKIETVNGEHELFVLTKDSFEKGTK